MRKPTTTLIDNQTKKEIIAMECSFNMACSFLESENKDNCFGNFNGTESVAINVCRLRFEKVSFLYDEIRGLLLREV